MKLAIASERVVLFCGSGATCGDSFSTRQCVEDDDVNVLCLGARVVGPSLAMDLARD